jgi:hypothetical protein
MAATLLVVVIAPRLVLALIAGGIERYRAAHLLEDMDEPYFARLLRGYRSSATAIDVLPYSFTLDDESRSSLQALLDRAMGGHAKLAIASPVRYGEEDDAPMPSGEIVVALFNASATPEPEAHGRFLAHLARGGRPLVVMVDEASLAARDSTRIEGRRALWRELASGHDVVFVDLARPDLETIEAEFARIA